MNKRISTTTSRCALLLTLSVLGLVGCVGVTKKPTQTSVPPDVIQSATRFKKEYVLTAGDQIEIAVRRTPEVSRTVVIRPDGMITLPLIDDVKASGLTPQELKGALTTLLAKRLIEPEVTVIATQVRQPVVYVVGDVNNNAGVVPLRDAPTAMQAIALSGGFRRSAAMRDTILIRLSDEGFIQAIPIGGGAKAQEGPFVMLRSTILRADDVVFIPESQRSQAGRILDDFINRPLSSVNSVFATYVNYRLVREINK